MLDRRGKVLAVTGLVAPSDAKLRRAQALALGNGTALKISKELISQKLGGQEPLIRDMLDDSATADAISRFRDELPGAESIEECPDGTRAGFAKATARIRGIGRRWRNSWVFRRREKKSTEDADTWRRGRDSVPLPVLITCKLLIRHSHIYHASRPSLM